MKKNLVQDVLPPKKSIRNIELPSKIKRENLITKETNEKKDPFERPISINKQTPIKIENTNPTNNIDNSLVFKKTPPPPPVDHYKYDYVEPKKSKKWIYVSSFLAIIVILFGVSALFKSAEIKITPKNQTLDLNEGFVAKKDLTGNNGLGFQIVTVTKEVEKVLDSGTPMTEKKVEKKATGKIVVYNNFSSKPQKLVATTRFETPEGLIFRLVEAVNVPGNSIKDGKTVAGSVEVTVEADKAGPSYNIGLKDFTIPGLKGDPKYSKIYGRSKTEMTGGFSGMQKLVSNEILSKIDSELESELKETLSKDTINQIPADFVLYQSSLSYKFDQAIQTNTSNGALAIKKKGAANAIIFEKASITRSILSKILPNDDKDIIIITNLDSLAFDFSLPSSSQNIGSTLNFTLKGKPELVWVFDENKLKSELLGISKNDAKTIIASYGAIEEAWITTKPFWNRTIPNNTEKVKLVNTVMNSDKKLTP